MATTQPQFFYILPTQQNTSTTTAPLYTTVLMSPHREMWRRVSHTIIIEILRLRLEMIHHQRNFDFCHTVGRSLVINHFTTIFTDYVPYQHLNCQKEPRRKFAAWKFSGRDGDPLGVLTSADRHQIANAFTPGDLPFTYFDDMCVCINEFIAMLMNFRKQELIQPAPLHYSYNNLCAANESIRKLLYFLASIGMEMLNIDHALQLGMAFPYKLLQFLTGGVTHQLLYIEKYLAVKMEKYSVMTNGFMSYTFHKPMRLARRDGEIVKWVSYYVHYEFHNVPEWVAGPINTSCFSEYIFGVNLQNYPVAPQMPDWLHQPTGDALKLLKKFQDNHLSAYPLSAISIDQCDRRRTPTMLRRNSEDGLGIDKEEVEVKIVGEEENLVKQYDTVDDVSTVRLT